MKNLDSELLDASIIVLKELQGNGYLTNETSYIKKVLENAIKKTLKKQGESIKQSREKKTLFIAIYGPDGKPIKAYPNGSKITEKIEPGSRLQCGEL